MGSHDRIARILEIIANYIRGQLTLEELVEGIEHEIQKLNPGK